MFEYGGGEVKRGRFKLKGDNLDIGDWKSYKKNEKLATERISGKKVSYRITERRAGDTAVVLANPAYAKEFLGWQAECSDLDTLLATTWQVYSI